MNEEVVKKSPSTKAYLKKVKKENRKKFLKKHRITLILLSIVIISFITIRVVTSVFFYTIDKIDADNMSKTIEIGDKVVVNKKYTSIERGGVYKFEKEGQEFIARCIGVGGDNIIVENNNVYVNGMLFSEKYVSSEIDGKINFTVDIPEGHIFVLGDNRNNSWDSRYWEDKFVKEEDVKGQVTEIYHLFGDNEEIKYY